MAPKPDNDEIHDSSSVVIFPDAKGVSSDLNSSKFGPVNPITIPKIKAVKFTVRLRKRKRRSLSTFEK